MLFFDVWYFDNNKLIKTGLLLSFTDLYNCLHKCQEVYRLRCLGVSRSIHRGVQICQDVSRSVLRHYKVSVSKTVEGVQACFDTEVSRSPEVPRGVRECLMSRYASESRYQDVSKTVEVSIRVQPQKHEDVEIPLFYVYIF